MEQVQHKPSPSQERTIRAHQTQRILELLAGKYVEPLGEAEVAEMKLVGARLHVELEWKEIDLSKETI